MRNFILGHPSFGVVTARRRGIGGAGDTTAPVLSAVDTSGAPDALSLTTNEAGTAYWMLHAGAAYTDGAALKTAVLASGGDARGSFVVVIGNNIEAMDWSAAGYGTFSFDIAQEDAVGNISGLSSTPVTRVAPSVNLLANGDFASATGWTMTGTWAISGGKAHYGPGAMWDSIKQISIVPSGSVSHKAYVVFSDIVSSGGEIMLRLTEENGENAGTQHNLSVTVPASPGQSSDLIFTPGAGCSNITFAFFSLTAVDQLSLNGAFFGVE